MYTFFRVVHVPLARCGTKESIEAFHGDHHAVAVLGSLRLHRPRDRLSRLFRSVQSEPVFHLLASFFALLQPFLPRLLLRLLHRELPSRSLALTVPRHPVPSHGVVENRLTASLRALLATILRARGNQSRQRRERRVGSCARRANGEERKGSGTEGARFYREVSLPCSPSRFFLPSRRRLSSCRKASSCQRASLRLSCPSPLSRANAAADDFPSPFSAATNPVLIVENSSRWTATLNSSPADASGAPEDAAGAHRSRACGFRKPSWTQGASSASRARHALRRVRRRVEGDHASRESGWRHGSHSRVAETRFRGRRERERPGGA